MTTTEKKAAKFDKLMAALKEDVSYLKSLKPKSDKEMQAYFDGTLNAYKDVLEYAKRI